MSFYKNLDIEFNALFSGGCKTRNEMKLDLNQYRVQTKAYNFYIWKRSVGLLLKQIPNSKMDVLANHKKTWPDKLWLHVPTRNFPPNQCGPRGRSATSSLKRLAYQLHVLFWLFKSPFWFHPCTTIAQQSPTKNTIQSIAYCTHIVH